MSFLAQARTACAKVNDFEYLSIPVIRKSRKIVIRCLISPCLVMIENVPPILAEKKNSQDPHSSSPRISDIGLNIGLHVFPLRLSPILFTDPTEYPADLTSTKLRRIKSASRKC